MKKIPIALLFISGMANAQTITNQPQGAVRQRWQLLGGLKVDSAFQLPWKDSARYGGNGYYSDLYFNKSDSLLKYRDPRTGLALSITSENTFIGTLQEIRLLNGVNYGIVITTNNGGGTWFYDPTDVITPDNTGTVLVTVDGKRYKRILSGEINFRWFGGITSSTVNQTTLFTNTITAANANSIKRVILPIDSIVITNGTDCGNVDLIGYNTSINGRLSNYHSINNVILLGDNNMDGTVSPHAYFDYSPRLLWRNSATDDIVIQQKGTGYLLSTFRINSTTTSASLAVTTSDSNRRRLALIQDCINAFVYNGTPSITSGTWSTISLSAANMSTSNISSYVTSGRAISYYRTTVVNSYIEYKTIPTNGYVSITLLCGTTGDSVVNLLVNDIGYIVSGISTSDNYFKTFTFPIMGNSNMDTVTVRVTKGTSDIRGVNVVGTDFIELKNWKNQYYRNFAYYRNPYDSVTNPTGRNEYLTQSSSNDAVIKEYNSGLYGVAYHGGETSILNTWYSNDNTITLDSVNAFKVLTDLKLKTSAHVSWAAFGGGYVDVSSQWRFGIGGISHECMFSGDIWVSEIYGHMFGTNESFTHIIYPKNIDLTLSSDGSRNILGVTNKYIMENPRTLQRYTGEFTTYNNIQNQYGGLHVWKVVGSYLKAYYGLCLGGKMHITNTVLTSNHFID